MNSNNEEEKLSKIENITVSTISSLGTVILYGTGINLSRNLSNGRPVFIGTIILSFISPHLLKTTTTYLLKKTHGKEKTKNIHNKNSRG